MPKAERISEAIRSADEEKEPVGGGATLYGMDADAFHGSAATGRGQL